MNFVSLVCFGFLIGAASCQSNTDSWSQYCQNHELNMEISTDLEKYYGTTVPLIGSDILGDAYEELYWRTRKNIIENHKKSGLSTDIVSNGDWDSIRSPLSYLRTINKIGKDLKELIAEKYKFDISSSYKEHHFNFSNIQNLRAEITFIETDGISREVMDGMMRIFIDIIGQKFLTPAGLEEPAMFTGFVPSVVANAIASKRLFIDDPLYSGLILHGKFTHLFQISMLIDQRLYDKHLIKGVIDSHAWGMALDSAKYRDPFRFYFKPCLYSSGSSTWITNHIDGHNPVIITLWFLNHNLSGIIRASMKSDESIKLFSKYLDVDQGDDALNRYTLEEMESNIRAVENFIILDLSHDITRLLDNINQVYNYDYLWNKHVLQFSYYPLWLFNVRTENDIMKDIEEDFEIYRKIHNISVLSAWADNREQYLAKAIPELLGMYVDLRFFENRIRKQLMPIRQDFIEKDHALSIMIKTSYYIISRIPFYYIKNIW